MISKESIISTRNETISFMHDAEGTAVRVAVITFNCWMNECGHIIYDLRQYFIQKMIKLSKDIVRRPDPIKGG